MPNKLGVGIGRFVINYQQNFSIVLQSACIEQLAVAVTVSRKKLTANCYCAVPLFFKCSLEKDVES
jgi:hypothetical protein